MFRLCRLPSSVGSIRNQLKDVLVCLATRNIATSQGGQEETQPRGYPVIWRFSTYCPTKKRTAKRPKNLPNAKLQENYNTPVGHTPCNPPSQLWKESLWLVKGLGDFSGVFQSCVETTLDKHLSILPGFSYDSSILCSRSFFNWETLKSDPSLKIKDLLAHSLDVDGLAMECCILGPLLWQRDALTTVELDGHKERSDLWNLMESFTEILWKYRISWISWIKCLKTLCPAISESFLRSTARAWAIKGVQNMSE